jgi:hypothetical protein
LRKRSPNEEINNSATIYDKTTRAELNDEKTESDMNEVNHRTAEKYSKFRSGSQLLLD